MDRGLCAILCMVAILFSLCIFVYCAEPPAEPTTVDTTEVSTEATTITEATEAAEVTEPTVDEVLFYNVPLDDDLQLHIIEVAVEYGIDPAIIIAMAYRESRYRANAIGDNGGSYGLLQIQKKWHSKRMKSLGCTDLLDPYQNVMVGIDYLAEQTKRYGGDIARGLTAYNKGHYDGTVTKYAKSILAHAEKLNKERGQ